MMSKNRKNLISKETKKKLLILVISIILEILLITVFMIMLRKILINNQIINNEQLSVGTCVGGFLNLAFLLVVYLAIKKPIKDKKIENEIVDERAKIINYKAGSKVFEFYIVMQVLANIICAFIGLDLIANFLSVSFAIQSILYIYFYSVENQKN